MRVSEYLDITDLEDYLKIIFDTDKNLVHKNLRDVLFEFEQLLEKNCELFLDVYGR